MAKKVSRYTKLREEKLAAKASATAKAPGRAGASGPRVDREVAIRDDMIRLGQFLKLADLADNGAEAREFIEQGLVAVNGEVALQRGRQLHAGDVVSAHGQSVQVSHEA